MFNNQRDYKRENPDHTGCDKIKRPAMYLVTSLISFFLFMAGMVLWCIDLYVDCINLSGSIYMVWCLCCLSMFCTNRVALREWKKRHAQLHAKKG